MNKTVVVLGAGAGGLTAAADLRKVLPAEDRIVLVDRAFGGGPGLSLLWVLRGWRTAEQVTARPTAAALPGVEMVTAEIERIDIDARTVHCGPAGSIGYDALVIALGAGLDTAALPGLPQALETGVAGQFYTLEGAADLHTKIEAMAAGRVMVLVAAVPFKCPAAPFEAAFLIADQLGEKFAGGAVRVDAFAPDALPMPVAGPAVGNALVGMMDTKGIGFHGGRSATAIDPHACTVEFADGTTESFDLLAVVPPHAPVAAVRSSGLGPNGWIPVDPATMATRAPGCSRSATVPRCSCPTANRCRKLRFSPKPRVRSPRTRWPATWPTTPPIPASPARVRASWKSAADSQPREKATSWRYRHRG